MSDKYKFKLKTIGTKEYIFDIVRKKYIQFTPEEKVRQHFIHYLYYELEYPLNFISVESGLKINKLDKRSDIMVFNREFTPTLMVECKSEKVKLTQKVMDQLAAYNLAFHMKFLIITNGLSSFCFELNNAGDKYNLRQSIPLFRELK